ncbi:MAG: capsule assembly Wzi family protein [Spirochaetales bacterium]|jgi:hypothetical protein|nr:capsule assembly Wzi family protein [Spirochaetales bacterium]
MKRRFLFSPLPAALLVFFLAAPGLFAQSQEVIPLTSGLYRDIDALYLMAGLARPSGARPWTINEGLLNLERVDAETLRGSARALYDRAAAELALRPPVDMGDQVRLGAALDLNLEGYAHRNTEAFINEEDWFYGYEERQPTLRLSLEGGIANLVFGRVEGVYGRGRFSPDDLFLTRKKNWTLAEDNPFPNGIGTILEPNRQREFSFRIRGEDYAPDFSTNLTTLDRMGTEWPRRAYLSAGGRRWNLTLGRDRLSWGNGQSGNFILDGHSDYNNFLRLNFFTFRFRWEYLMVFHRSWDYFGYDRGWGDEDEFRVLLAHRLEFRIRDNLSLSLAEAVMYQDRTLDLQYINPSFIFHNYLDKTRFNALASLELDFSPAPGWGAYLQFALDQFTAPTESGRSAENSPAMGLLGGLRSSFPGDPGVWSFHLEGAYTSPMLYRRDYVDFLVIRTNEFEDSRYAIEYAGYPYGGDAIVLQLEGGYRGLSGWEGGFKLFSMLHGRTHFLLSHNSSLINNEEANLPGWAPLGKPEEIELTLAASLNGKWRLPSPVRAMALTAWGQFDGVTRRNKLMYSPTARGEDIIYHLPGWTWDLQLTLGLGIQFR